MRTNTSPFRGGYYSHGKQFIETLPVPVPDDATRDAIEALVRKLIGRLDDLAAAYMPRGRIRLERDRDADERGMEQPFRLQLRSQASGDATLLHCSSEVGPVEIEQDDYRLDELYELQRELKCAKVCVHPDPADRTDRISVEGDIVFHPDTTQLEELESLVTRTVGAAGVLASRLVEQEDI